MEPILANLISIICVDISYTGLLSKRLSPLYHLIIMINYVFWGNLVGAICGQWITLPVVFFSCLTVFIGTKRSVFNAILAIVGYFMCTLTNHLISIPLSLIGISLDIVHVEYRIPFLLSWLLLTALTLYLVRRFLILPKLEVFENCSPKLLWILLGQLFFCVTIFMINFVYGSYIHYPPEALSFNGLLIVVFTLFTFVIFYCLFNVFYQNQQLKLQQQEQAHLLEYAGQMESFYEEMRIFRHDYRNILTTMQHYIDAEDIPQLKEYFQTKIAPSGKIMSDLGFTAGKLHLIENVSLKSILYAKLINAKNKGLEPLLEITEPIPKLAVDELTLARLLGILLDNCIEAAAETEEKHLKIALVSKGNHVICSLVNSTQPLTTPLTSLSQSGFTTKHNHDGLGLVSAHKLLETMGEIVYTVGYDDYFRQTLEIPVEK